MNTDRRSPWWWLRRARQTEGAVNGLFLPALHVLKCTDCGRCLKSCRDSRMEREAWARVREAVAASADHDGERVLG